MNCTVDMLVLRVLVMGPAHGHTIAHAIEHERKDTMQVAHGLLYPALHGLETRGWIASCWGTAGNRRARYYCLTSAGVAEITGREDVPLVQVFLGVSIALVLSARPSAQVADGRPVLEVITEDRSSGGAELGVARARVRDIFITAGIRVVWSARTAAATGATGTDRTRLVVLSGLGADAMFHGHPDLLGLAVPSANRVYIHYDRVLALARHDRTPPGWFLGIVIAHEVAHVLLPDAGHADNGLMGAWLDPETTPAFTAQQAQSLRARLHGGVMAARGVH